MPKVIHAPIETLSDEARKLFPSAKLLIAIDWDEADPRSDTMIRTLVGDPAAKLLRTNLATGASTTAALEEGNQRLLPDLGEVLQITAPDKTVQACFSKPYWRWFSVKMTEIE